MTYVESSMAAGLAKTGRAPRRSEAMVATFMMAGEVQG